MMVHSDRSEHSSSDVMPYNFSEFSLVLARMYPSIRRELLTDLVNMNPEKSSADWFWRKWKGKLRYEPTNDLLILGADLRYLWKKPNTLLVDHMLNEWLAWRPSGLNFKKHIHSAAGPDDAEWVSLEQEQSTYLPFRCSIEAKMLLPRSVNLRAMLIQGVFENFEHFKICANPKCGTPHFIAKRKTQTVCDAEFCKAEKQREHALKWWNENRAKASQETKPDSVNTKAKR